MNILENYPTNNSYVPMWLKTDKIKTMKKLLPLLIFLFPFLFSCSKEVKIDIPGYEEQLCIDGSIETGMPPIVLLSKSQDIYAPTNLDAFLNSFISGATVTVSNGSSTVVLDEICTDNLPAGSEELAAQLFGIPVAELANYHLCAYTTLNTSVWGEVGKTYYLTVNFEGKTYTSSTQIVTPTNLTSSFWKPDGNSTEWGYSWASIADQANQYDGYKWEVKRINIGIDGQPRDAFFTKTYNPFFDDAFFDGLTFDFFYENPMSWDDPAIPSEGKGFYHLGDSVVIKLSKVDENVFNYYEKKFAQIQTAGNPFATPTNIPTNITGGALGVWAGFSPTYDTLYCVE